MSTWCVNPDLESGSIAPRPGGVQVIFGGGSPGLEERIRAAGPGGAIGATLAKVGQAEEVVAYRDAKRQYDEAVVLRSKAEAEAALAKAEADVVRLRPTPTLADDIRRLDARLAEARSAHQRAADAAETIRGLLPGLHRRAADHVAQVATHFRSDQARRLREERPELIRRFTEQVGVELEDLVTNVRAYYAIAWCKANGIPEPKSWHITMGVRATRKRRVRHDHEKSHREWKEKADREAPDLDERMRMKPGKEPNSWLSDLLNTYLTTPWKVIYEGIRAAYRKDPQAIVISNIDVFLYQASKRPAIEGHRAALHAMRWGTFSSIKEALKTAERAYREARRPKLHLERKAKVIVSRFAVPTEEQKTKFDALAERKGWTVEFEDQKEQQAWQKRQQQKTHQQTQRMGVTP